MTYQFYCRLCIQHITGSSLFDLVNKVNAHNRVRHPFECDTWDETELRESANFSQENEKSAPPMSYDIAKPLAVKLNAFDAEWLSSLGVRWD